MASTSYAARPIKRLRATAAEMAERRELLVDLAASHGPCSVRHLFYAAVVARMPGVTKDKHGYAKVQRLALELRRAGRIPYRQVVDNTRLARYLDTWDSPDEFLADMAGTYRRNLWSRTPYRVEVWCESDSISSTVAEVVITRWRLQLMVCRGFSSETFAYNAAEAWRDSPRQPVVLYIGDHDPHGLEIESNLREKLTTFAEVEPVWHRIGVTWDQVVDLDLPGTTPKKSYGFPQAVEAEALPAPMLREMLDNAISAYVDPHQLEVLQVAEADEREGLELLFGGWNG